MISNKKYNRGVIFLVFCLPIFISVAQAEQTSDFTFCGSMTVTSVSGSEELRISTFDGKGIVLDTFEKKLFDNMTFHLVGVGRDMFGKGYQYGFVKFMDPDGGFVFTENIALPDEKEGNFKFLWGTGKWKGIKGEGKVRRITSGKPIAPGTIQVCWKLTGTFDIQKGQIMEKREMMEHRQMMHNMMGMGNQMSEMMGKMSEKMKDMPKERMEMMATMMKEMCQHIMNMSSMTERGTCSEQEMKSMQERMKQMQEKLSQMEMRK